MFHYQVFEINEYKRILFNYQWIELDSIHDECLVQINGLNIER